MPVSSNNKFSRARRHLRSTQIDEKLQLLNEIPTNNTSSYYTIEPDVVTVTPAVRAEFDLTADDPALVGKDTSGLFDGNGAVLTQQPPGDTTYILGPMVSVYFPDGDYSAIGYIQKDTRKVINLARIPGEVKDWALDGTTEGFTSYSQLTLEQALWYRDQLIAGDTTPYRVFYIGVFEQILSDPGVTDPSAGIDIDEYGRWLGQIINLGYEIEPEKIEVTPGQKGPDPNIPPGEANPILSKLKKKIQRGENLTIDDFPSVADFSAFKNGGGNAALRQGKTIGEVINQGKINLGQYDSGPRNTTGGFNYDDYLNSLPPGVRDDMLKGGQTASPLGDIAILGATAGLVKGAVAVGLTKIGLTLSGITAGDQAKKTFIDKADNAGQYNQQLAGKLVTSILSGQPQEIELSPAAKKDQIKNVDQEQFSQALQIGPIQKPSANSTVNPTQKRQVLTGGWGAQGGSEVRYDPKTDTLTITSEKMLRTGLEGDKFDGDRQTAFGDIPEPTDAQVSDMTKKLMTGPLEPLMQGLSGVAQVISGGKSNTWEKIKSNPELLQTFSNNMGKASNDLAKGAVQGTASNTVVLRKVLTNLGFPQSEVEKTGGGYGQVYSQTAYKGNEIPKEVRGIINTKLSGISESFKRKKILSEVKKPYILVEVKKEKIKHRPKVIKPNDCGTRVVGADLMKQAEVPTSFKRIEDTMWKKQERAQNTRFSQERKNMILDSVGTADHAWEWMTDKSKKKNEKSVYENFGPKNSVNEDLKNRIISKKQVGNDSIIKMYNENGEIEIITQSVLNERLQKEYELQLKEQETLNAPNDPLVKRIKNKLYTQIDYPDKPAKMGYPNELPLPLGQDGYHIQYGDRADYYNRLDRHSADTMSNPLTGNEKIDAKVLDQTTSAKVNKLITKMRDKKKQSKINSSLENQ